MVYEINYFSFLRFGIIGFLNRCGVVYILGFIVKFSWSLACAIAGPDKKTGFLGMDYREAYWTEMVW